MPAPARHWWMSARASPRSRCCRTRRTDDTWWVALLHHEPRLHIIGRLPFWEPRPDGAPAAQALVVASTAGGCQRGGSVLPRPGMRQRRQPGAAVERTGRGGTASRNPWSLARQQGSPDRQRAGRGRGLSCRTTIPGLAHLGPVLRRPVVLGSYAVPIAGGAAMTGPSPRPEILTIHPYVAGESELPGANRTVKLSSNEGAFGVPPSAQAAIAKAAAEVLPLSRRRRRPAARGDRQALGPGSRSASSAAPDRTTCCISSACPTAVPGATSSCRRMGSRSTTSPGPMPAAG